MAWVKIPPEDNWWVCEYGCYNYEFDLHEEKCNHSSDVNDHDGRHNCAHWKRTGADPRDTPHCFLCNYHYEELVLRITGPTDDEIKAMEKALEPLSAEEFSAGIGEVK